MAYTPLSPVHAQWKNYRGGTASTIWLFTFADRSVIKVPQPQGGCNDTHPMWVGDRIYFLSDRNGEFNLFSCNGSGADIRQHTTFTDFPVISASAARERSYLNRPDTFTHLTRQRCTGKNEGGNRR
jgi:tricorn protease